MAQEVGFTHSDHVQGLTGQEWSAAFVFICAKKDTAGNNVSNLRRCTEGREVSGVDGPQSPQRSPLACWRGNPGVACASWRGQLLARLADLPMSFQEPRGFSFAAGDRGDAGALLVHSPSISRSCDCKALGAWSRAPLPARQQIGQHLFLWTHP